MARRPANRWRADWDVLRQARASAGTALVEGRVVEKELRCSGCGQRFAIYAAPPFAYWCRECKTQVKSAPLG
jgi:hypothetical protein